MPQLFTKIISLVRVEPRRKTRKNDAGGVAPEVSEIEERLESLILRVGEKVSYSTISFFDFMLFKISGVGSF